MALVFVYPFDTEEIFICHILQMFLQNLFYCTQPGVKLVVGPTSV